MVSQTRAQLSALGFRDLNLRDVERNQKPRPQGDGPLPSAARSLGCRTHGRQRACGPTACLQACRLRPAHASGDRPCLVVGAVTSSEIRCLDGWLSEDALDLLRRQADVCPAAPGGVPPTAHAVWRPPPRLERPSRSAETASKRHQLGRGIRPPCGGPVWWMSSWCFSTEQPDPAPVSRPLDCPV